MVDGVDRDVHEVSSSGFDRDREYVDAGAAQLTTNLLTCGRDDDGRPLSRQLHQGVCEHHDERGGAVTDCRLRARRRPHDGDRSQRHKHVADSVLAYDDEVGADGDQSASRRASAEGAHRHRAAALGQVDQDSCQRRTLGCLAFEPPLTRSRGRRGVDPALSDPA